MGIKHSAVKATGEKGYASEWNADHVVDDNVDFNSKKITSLATPTENTDGATKKYVDDNIGGATALSQLAIDVSKNWQGYQIKNLADPTLDQDAATKFYVDSATGTPPVLSVFGRTGDVVATTNDYTWAQVNKTVSNIADITTKSHTSLTDKGTNTHAQIDTHLASAANPHSVTYTQVGAIQNAADTVKDTHVDWGTGASQVSADDVPDGITNKMLTNQAQTIAGVKTFSSFPLTPSSAPTTDYQTANKKYVDDAGAMVQHANEWHTPDMVSTTGNQTVAGTKTFSSFPFTPSAAPTSNYEVANKAYADTMGNDVKLTGNQTVAGIKTFSSFPVTPSVAPTSNYEVSNKKYVDDKLLIQAGRGDTDANGILIVDFTTAFSATPAVTANPFLPSGNQGFCSFTGIGTTQVIIKLVDFNGANLASKTIYWIATGRTQ